VRKSKLALYRATFSASSLGRVSGVAVWRLPWWKRSDNGGGVFILGVGFGVCAVSLGVWVGVGKGIVLVGVCGVVVLRMINL